MREFKMKKKIKVRKVWHTDPTEKVFKTKVEKANDRKSWKREIQDCE